MSEIKTDSVRRIRGKIFVMNCKYQIHNSRRDNCSLYS